MSSYETHQMEDTQIELDQPGAAEARSTASGHAAGNAAMQTEFISFAIGDQQYGVDIMAVREIKEWTKATSLPNQPDYVRGVLNLRGAMIPIIDLRHRFGGGVTEASPMHVVIIASIGSRQIGMLADRALDIVSFDTSAVQPVPNYPDSVVCSPTARSERKSV